MFKVTAVVSVTARKVLNWKSNNELRQLSQTSYGMPKKKPTPTSTGNKPKENTEDCSGGVTTHPAVTCNKSGDILISIQARPGAKLTACTELTPDGLGVHISAPAQEGEANAELTRYLSQILQVRKSDVSLAKGGKSRQKVVCIAGSGLSVSDVIQKLQQNIKS